MKQKTRVIFKLLLIFLTALVSMDAKAQLPNVINGFLGNTFNGGNNKWVPNYAQELDVASDGTMITASIWEEAGRCVGIFKNGQPLAYLKQYNGAGGHNCWGWGTSTKATAVDDNYVYVNNCDGDLLRFSRTNNYTYIDKTATGEQEGMTYSAGFLYMVQASGVVQKRSVTSIGTIALSFTVSGGYDIAVDAAGNMWVLTTNNEVIKYDATGVITGVKIAAQSGWEPSAVNYDAFNNVLLVPDNGARRQVIKFNTLGVQVGTFGDLGGISAGSKGIVGDLRFWNISGAGTDASGNIYVALNENCVSLRKFNANGVKQWEVLGTMFTDITSIDPDSDGNDIYSINEHMKYNYSTQQWSLTAITLDRTAYPTDPRNKVTGTEITSALMRRVNGNLIMFTSGMYAGGYDVYKFEGETAVFTQKISNIGWSGLPDKDGNIWYEAGGRIMKIPLTGFTNGNPVFGVAVDVTTTIPAPITKIERIEYDVVNDVMFIAGWTRQNPNRANNWGLIGSTIAQYPNWSTGNRLASNTAVMPKDIEGLYPKAMSVANDYVFVGGSRDRGKIYVYKTSNLSSVGYIAPPTNMGEIGWLDIPHAVQAFKKSNGQYVILVEDNSKGKNIVYQWCATGNCNSGVPVTGATLSPPKSSLAINDTKQLSATILPANATNKNVTWNSSNTAVATVSSTGLVTAITEGYTIVDIVTSDGAKTATTFIKVGSSFPVAYTSTPITIDGTLVETVWNINNSIAKAVFGTTNNEGKFNLLWDNNYLYVGAMVKDDILKPFTTGNPWNFDGMEFYIDGNQNKETAYDAFDIQIVKALGATGIFTSRTATGILSATSTVSGGYSIELAIPWSVVRATPEAGLGLGFDIGYNDNNTGIRNAVIVWKGDGNNFNNTSAFDDLILLSPGSLPLNFESFTATLKNNEVALHWKSNNEVNVSHFEIERSADGTMFTRINKSISSNGGGNYTDKDTSPLNGNNYYRLKAVDTDGTSTEYPQIRVIKFGLDRTAEFSIYPNPNNGNFTISPSQSKLPCKVTIYNQQGQTMINKEILGTTNFSVGNLAKGVYLIQLNTGGLVEVKKMVKE